MVRAAGADHDALLRFALHEQRHPNVYGPFGFAKLLDLGGKSVGQLVLEQLEGGFAEILDDEEAHGLGADVLRVEGELRARAGAPRTRASSRARPVAWSAAETTSADRSSSRRRSAVTRSPLV